MPCCVLAAVVFERFYGVYLAFRFLLRKLAGRPRPVPAPPVRPRVSYSGYVKDAAAGFQVTRSAQ